MTKPKWQERMEGMIKDINHLEMNRVERKGYSGYNQAIDELIPIITEEMQKQREEVISELEDYIVYNFSKMHQHEIYVAIKDKLIELKNCRSSMC